MMVINESSGNEYTLILLFHFPRICTLGVRPSIASYPRFLLTNSLTILPQRYQILLTIHGQTEAAPRVKPLECI
jgi:hypothetical protein